MWSPIDIFALVFLLNHSPMENERLSVKEIIKTQENKLIIQSVRLRNDIQSN